MNTSHPGSSSSSGSPLFQSRIEASRLVSRSIHSARSDELPAPLLARVGRVEREAGPKLLRVEYSRVVTEQVPAEPGVALEQRPLACRHQQELGTGGAGRLEVGDQRRIAPRIVASVRAVGAAREVKGPVLRQRQEMLLAAGCHRDHRSLRNVLGERLFGASRRSRLFWCHIFRRALGLRRFRLGGDGRGERWRFGRARRRNAER